ncbi:hypothetical protein PENNAL_c0010G06668 [Penicillium nalgiovense]|uniref:Uncharacterized protein n=1 Tax=Penicillium nalgiovense TaxID=60175 RepID=A0A1V6YV58_PENNA|nr:hypothetical protein PENNAL_c0010G06668 [Penicillium nalgiovense]
MEAQDDTLGSGKLSHLGTQDVWGALIFEHQRMSASKFGFPAQQQLWYSAYDVTTELGSQQWQMQLVPKLLAGFAKHEAVLVEISDC